MTKRNIIEPNIKRRIWENQNGLCAYCGRHRNIKYMTVDHIIPISKGGTDDLVNLQCVCKSCNDLKSDMLPYEFTKFIKKIMKRSRRIEKYVENIQ